MTTLHILVDSMSCALNISQAGFIWLLMSQNKRQHITIGALFDWVNKYLINLQQDHLNTVNILTGRKTNES